MRAKATQASRAPPSRPNPTRARILKQAEALIAAQGVFGFSLKDVAACFEVRVRAIYQYYESRDEVLIDLSRRFIALLSDQFSYAPQHLAHPVQTLQQVVEEFVRFHVEHPAYVRLSLIDFASPHGGLEHVRMAAGGPFRSRLTEGPLAPMHIRLARLIEAGQHSGDLREISETDVYSFLKSVLLLRLVFPDDLLRGPPVSDTTRRMLERQLWESALQHLARDP